MEGCPLTFAGGHAAKGRCPLTFVRGHETIEKSVSGFRIGDHPLSERWSLLWIFDFQHL